MSTNKLECIDAGSEFCPCHLAQTNDCMICSHLQGKEFCDCDWSGVCIYQEFYWNGNHSKDARKEVMGTIVQKKQVEKDIMIFKIRIPKHLARQLKHPGSYVFVKRPKDPTYFHVPMSIMDVDDQTGEIKIAIQVLGVKTKSLLECEDALMIKGPYWNGIIGLKKLKKKEHSKVLLVARGIALAPALLTLKYLQKHENHVTFITDPGKREDVFIQSELKDFTGVQKKVNIREPKGQEVLRKLLISGGYDLVCSEGSDKFHRIIQREIDKVDKNIDFVISNNSQMCCGEGVCGSCTFKTKEGKNIRMCKAQIQPREVLEGRK